MEVTEVVNGIANGLLPTVVNCGVIVGICAGLIPVAIAAAICHFGNEIRDTWLARLEKRKARKDAEKEGGEE